MTASINASTSSGVVVTSDTSGNLALQSNGTNIATVTSTGLSDGTNTISMSGIIQGSAKAWGRFTGSTATINASYNISSITRNGAGLYSINMTNAMSDTNYGVVCSASPNGANGLVVATSYSNNATATTPTTTNFLLETGNPTIGYADSTYITFAVFR
jgi:hypothetical protein